LAAEGGDARAAGGPGLGGAIYNYRSGSLTIRRSTLNDNLAGGGGGGDDDVAGVAIGGAIGNFDSGTFTIEKSTVTGNSAIAGAGDGQDSTGGGINSEGGSSNPSTVLGTTISNNVAFRGSNLFTSGGAVRLRNTIVASPRRPDANPGRNCDHPGFFPSAIESLGYNIDSGSSC
jgi:hypothetical protein